MKRGNSKCFSKGERKRESICAQGWEGWRESEREGEDRRVGAVKSVNRAALCVC